MSKADGVIGLAPDKIANGPSFLSSLYNLKIIDKLEIGARVSSDGSYSKLTLGGVDERGLFDFQTQDGKKWITYDNKNDSLEWGIELTDIYIGNKTHNVSFDSGSLTYAKIDMFNNYISFPLPIFTKYKAYLKEYHPEMNCVGGDSFLYICYAK